jgi:hypothetical protein
VSLERRTARGGRDTIDHPPGGHDDVANAVAGACTLAIGKSDYDTTFRFVDGDYDSDNDDRAARRLRFQQFILSGGVLGR